MICVSIILPTYNEADNIEIVIPLINKYIIEATNCYEIIVVDDNSPDGTAYRALKFKDVYPIRVFIRKGVRGLSSAIVFGASKARYDYVIVMDADLQHPPSTIPNIVKLLEKGCDIVVATRYSEGGGVLGWSRLRYLESRLATFLAHLINPWTRVTSDPMSGFFGCRREYLLNPLIKPRGYKILVEVLSKSRYCKPRVCDVPYVFRSRVYGRSKLGSKTIIEYLIQLLDNLFYNPRRY